VRPKRFQIKEIVDKLERTLPIKWIELLYEFTGKQKCYETNILGEKITNERSINYTTTTRCFHN
jgi:hypothetical protein